MYITDTWREQSPRKQEKHQESCIAVRRLFLKTQGYRNMCIFVT